MRKMDRMQKEKEKSEKKLKQKAKRNNFDKKKYRLQKYSNKYQVKQWDERRKKAIIRSFHKELQKDDKIDIKANFPTEDNSQKNIKIQKNKNPFVAAQERYQNKEAERKSKKEDKLKQKAKIEEALRKYREKKMQIYKILSKKTKKGQPVMKGRIELLLEKIQKSMQDN